MQISTTSSGFLALCDDGTIWGFTATHPGWVRSPGHSAGANAGKAGEPDLALEGKRLYPGSLEAILKG